MLLRKRILAALIDYIIILVYGLILFSISITLVPFDELSKKTDPVHGQLIGFFSLTLPVILYFYIMESSKLKASLGKLALKIHVGSNGGSVLKRTILKFLPWEVAHLGVHWIYFYEFQNHSVPLWVWIVLILPQAVSLLYFFSIVYSKGKSSLYDQMAHTSIAYHP
ncbi:RDD family protein [Hanstruepera marina]|uniref:RDD family protein n=1 Tax=Hanstruepera marina TaxID=2873265 RepID=UPI001CA6AFEE|nr:RDD family protein [Hanstruepera marina]